MLKLSIVLLVTLLFNNCIESCSFKISINNSKPIEICSEKNIKMERLGLIDGKADFRA